MLGIPYLTRDQRSTVGDPSSMVMECRGNTIIWNPLEGGPATFPGVVPPTGVTVHNGPSFRHIWETARDQWLANHQEVDRRASVSST
jgi:hypothetical protein